MKRTTGGDAAAPSADRTQTIVRGSSADARGCLAGGSTVNLNLIEGDPDRYTSEGEHARGGLGRVIRASDHRMGRTVAIKELLQSSRDGEARFVREALITARLQHPGIVPVHEAGRWPDGEPYYVMKLISGRSLKELIRDAAGLEQRLALLPNIATIAETIAYAHSERVIHRDIKPANVVIGDFGETVVVDWGIAKDNSQSRGHVAGDADEQAGSAAIAMPEATAGVLGTPAYMPPEQAAGEEVDERSDVYSLGAVLYELLAGSQPFSKADSENVLASLVAGPPSPVESLQSGVPADLLAIVRKAMARSPSQRYQSARAFADDLKRFQTGNLVSAHNYSALNLARRWMWRNRGLVGVAVAAVTILVVLGAIGLSRIVTERNLAQVERNQARAATLSAEKRQQQLLLLQARSSLENDPTATVAWLKTYPDDGPGFAPIRAMINAAEAKGVATHVIRLGDWGYDASFSADGKRLAVASKDKTIRLVDVEAGSSRILGHTEGPVHSVAMSPNGKELVSGTDSGSLAVWRIKDGAVQSWPAHSGAVTDVRYAPDGRRFSSLSEYWDLRVWDAASRKQVYRAAGRSAVSASGDAVATWDEAAGVAIAVSTLTLEKRRTPAGESEDWSVEQIAVANGGRSVAIRTSRGKIYLHSAAAEGNATASQWRLVGVHPGKVDKIQFSPRGTYLVSMGYDRTIRVFTLKDVSDAFVLADAPMPATQTKAASAAPMDVFRGHSDAIYMVAFSPDESFMVSASDDGTARIWNFVSGASRVLRGHGDDVYRVALSPDGSRIATVSLDASVRVWPARIDKSRALVHPSALAFVAFAGPNHVITHGYDGRLTRWALAGGAPQVLGETGGLRMRLRPQLSAHGGVIVAPDIAGHGIGVWDTGAEAAAGEVAEFKKTLLPDEVAGGKLASFAISPDGTEVAASYRTTAASSYRSKESATGVIGLWNVGTQRLTILAEGRIASGIQFSPDGAEIAVAHGRRLTIWNRKEQSVVYESDFLEEGARVPRAAILYSPDSRQLALSGGGGQVSLVDRGSGTVRKLSTGAAQLTYAAFSPDGSWVAAAAADRTVRLWDVRTGEQRVLRGHTDLVHMVAFSPDGKLLASASYDKTVRLWDPRTGESTVIRGHSASVDSVVFSPDGRQLVTASRDRSARIWDVGAVMAAQSPEAVRERMSTITSAVIAADDRPQTVQDVAN